MYPSAKMLPCHAKTLAFVSALKGNASDVLREFMQAFAERHQGGYKPVCLLRKLAESHVDHKRENKHEPIYFAGNVRWRRRAGPRA